MAGNLQARRKTVNFDGIFDHILYGPRYGRGSIVTDFWRGDGALNHHAAQKVKIHHLHGDLRYKPFKKTQYNLPPYRWPVLVVGDQEVKKGLIAGQESLRFYNNRLRAATDARDPGVTENVLAIIGFGFRDEDQHIVSRIKYALANASLIGSFCSISKTGSLQFAKSTRGLIPTKRTCWHSWLVCKV